MKFWALFILVFAAAYPAFANCIAGDCQNGQGKARFKNGDLYTGQWRQGLMHGRGIYVFRSRARYEGEFAKGAMHGQGKMRYPDGAVYEGQWADNKKAGRGRLVTPSGKTQHGNWVNGEFAGAASSTSAVAQNKPARKPADGNAATTAPIAKPPISTAPAAAATAGMRDCNAVYCEDGTGRYRYRDGAVYVGYFEDGQPSGNGKVEYANGDEYTGEWFGNAPDGKGTYTFANGRSVLGVWEDGRLTRRLYRNAEGSAVAQNPAAPPPTDRPTAAPTNRRGTAPPRCTPSSSGSAPTPR